MKSALKRASLVVSAFVLCITLARCGGGSSTSSSNSTTQQPSVTLVSLAITPAAPSVAAGKTQQLSASGSYSDSSSKDMTTSVTWTSSDQSVVKVNSSGLATAIKKGSATITAASGSVSKTALLTVTDAVLLSITMQPASASVANGQTQQFAAYGIYSDNSQTDLTGLATWAVVDGTIASVKNGGLATGMKQGATKITATVSGITGNADLNVTAAVLTQLDLTPDTASIPSGAAQALVATGTFSDGSTQDLTNVQWSSSDSNVARVDSDGLVKAVSAGEATITGQVGTLSDTAIITVTPATLVSIAIAPAAPSLAKGTSQQFTAIGTFTDGSTQDITAAVTWSSDRTNIATVDASGTVKAVDVGTAVVSASSAGKSNSVTLFVTSAVVSSIAITPANSSMGIGGTQQFTATATFTDASTQDLTTQVTWSSSDASRALISNTGLANALAQGVVTLNASFGGVTGSTTWTVISATLSSISIVPDSPVVPAHAKVKFSAAGVFSDGSTRALAGVTWSSSKPRYAVINGSGVLRTKRQGATTVRAYLNGKTGSTTVTITNSPITSIVVTPATATVSVGGTKQFTATGYFSDGGLPAQDLTPSVYWKTSDYTTATINSSGLATGVKRGTANITATFGTVVSAPVVLTVE